MSKDRWEELRENALAGDKRRDFCFLLVELVDPDKYCSQDVMAWLADTIDYHAIAYGQNKYKATKTVFENVRYISGYYGNTEQWVKIMEKFRKEMKFYFE